MQCASRSGMMKVRPQATPCPTAHPHASGPVVFTVIHMQTCRMYLWILFSFWKLSGARQRRGSISCGGSFVRPPRLAYVRCIRLTRPSHPRGHSSGYAQPDRSGSPGAVIERRPVTGAPAGRRLGRIGDTAASRPHAGLALRE